MKRAFKRIKKYFSLILEGFDGSKQNFGNLGSGFTDKTHREKTVSEGHTRNCSLKGPTPNVYYLKTLLPNFKSMKGANLKF